MVQIWNIVLCALLTGATAQRPKVAKVRGSKTSPVRPGAGPTVGPVPPVAGPTISPVPVTPVQKVIALLEDMKSEAEKVGSEEATTYAEFSCFCKTTTGTKSQALVDGKDAVLSLSAAIQKDTASKNEDSAELAERKKKQNKLKLDKAKNRNDCEAQKLEYEANEADVSKAIYGLDKAIESMETSKPVGVLLQTGTGDSLADIVAMAKAMGMIKPPMQKAASHVLRQTGKSAFLQQKLEVDPSEPTYAFHSDDIISLCKELKDDFESQKKTLDDDWAETDKTCKSTDSSLTNEMGNNDDAMTALKTSIDGLTAKIARDMSTMKVTQGTMLEDELYLKDLTKQCEVSAAEWDQRSDMCKAELTALTDAIAIIKRKVKTTDAYANERALLQQSAKSLSVSSKKALAHPMVFLQKASESKKSGRSIVMQQSSGALSAEARKGRALATLQKEGQRLNSLALQSLTAKAAADPFTKVKELIQKLIERLVAEAAGETEKKGFCDTQMAKAKKSRDYRYTDVLDLNAEVAGLESKRDLLKAESASLKEEIATLKADLKKATGIRNAEKTENLKVIATAETGLKALKEAIDILQTFYRKADRATVLTQVSPIEEDTDGAGFSGAYKGQQTRSVAVFGLLENIQADYERTIKTRTADEAEAHADFTEFKKTSEADISGKSKKQELDEEDLGITLATIDSKMGDLKTNMDLLDKAMKELVDLNPMCVDSGMSYKERKETREQEIAALGQALCQLDGEGVEEECKQGQERE
mmetsp:Transcript_126469/g.236425  ORF Transcript_126469/g.236425 Transcript_126469/m.236425 type:complete len:760 (+) Transcript_126469:85-2364(+)